PPYHSFFSLFFSKTASLRLPLPLHLISSPSLYPISSPPPTAETEVTTSQVGAASERRRRSRVRAVLTRGSSCTRPRERRWWP
ncbi:Os01g0693466, partial [Oryza sativa Japonica Group]